MRSFIKNATVFALLVAVTAGAAFAITYYADPFEAAENDTRAVRTRDRYENDGYALVQVTFQQYYYFVQPETPYVYGTYTYQYQRPCQLKKDQDLCLGNDYAEITVEVSLDDPGYFVSRISTEEYTVY